MLTKTKLIWDDFNCSGFSIALNEIVRVGNLYRISLIFRMYDKNTMFHFHSLNFFCNYLEEDKKNWPKIGVEPRFFFQFFKVFENILFVVQPQRSCQNPFSFSNEWAKKLFHNEYHELLMRSHRKLLGILSV